MKKIIISLLCFVGAFALEVQARENLTLGQAANLTPEQIEEFKIRIAAKIDEFQSQLEYIGSKKSTEATKDAATKAALDLFIGKGQPYTVTDLEGNRINKPAVKMQVSSKKRRTPNTILLKTYLNNLRYSRYSKLVIEQSDAVRVDNIYQTGPGQYEAVAYFCQDFYGYRDGKVVYHDTTEKAVRVHIRAIESPEIGQVVWEAYLGDIKVLNTY